MESLEVSLNLNNSLKLMTQPPGDRGFNGRIMDVYTVCSTVDLNMSQLGLKSETGTPGCFWLILLTVDHKVETYAGRHLLEEAQIL